MVGRSATAECNATLLSELSNGPWCTRRTGLVQKINEWSQLVFVVVVVVVVVAVVVVVVVAVVVGVGGVVVVAVVVAAVVVVVAMPRR